MPHDSHSPGTQFSGASYFGKIWIGHPKRIRPFGTASYCRPILGFADTLQKLLSPLGKAGQCSPDNPECRGPQYLLFSFVYIAYCAYACIMCTCRNCLDPMFTLWEN